ncbi:biopolymer transporter ExbD [Fulvivirga kasyanovii]|uniref:Biopolymer transporter ExbD n=1 Tax=Fulvivirga kasyanovii TaxID=396812 RepID=A0ABW9RVL3_9BACT|nr:biopolymer transporter ExbD [Fulvivirga kasyanovii]MTI27746.1 biopolymer transporter ExbD [Fulvivirga kasyanovii]
MALRSKHTVEPMFSMSSMTDIIFLLLIFFMLTSSFITPSGLPVNLPTSRAATVELQKVSVTITKNLDYYVNDKKVSKGMLEGELKSKLKGTDGVVVLHIDESVPTQHLVNVAGIATALEAKVSIATKPN